MTIWAEPWLSRGVIASGPVPSRDCQRSPGQEAEVLLHGPEERGVHLFVLVPVAAWARRPSPPPQIVTEGRQRFPGPDHDVAPDADRGPAAGQAWSASPRPLTA